MCLRHRLMRGFPRINTRAIEYHKLAVLASKKIFVDLFKASWDRSLGMEFNYIDIIVLLSRLLEDFFLILISLDAAFRMKLASQSYGDPCQDQILSHKALCFSSRVLLDH